MTKQLWTPEEVLDRIRHLHKAGHELSWGNALEVAPKLVFAAQRYFGSWGRAVGEAGIDYSAAAQAARQRALEKKTKWSRDRIVEHIRELAEKNQSLRASIVRRTCPELYAAACSSRYFNGWGSALEAAGLEARGGKPGKPSEHTALLAKWRVELLLERIRQIAGPDGPVDERSIQIMAPELHAQSIRRFGSWKEVIRGVRSAGRLGRKTYRRLRQRV